MPRFSYPLRLLLVTAGTIFLTEGLIMAVLPSLPDLSPLAGGLLDAAVLTLMVCPVLFWTLVRPMSAEVVRRRRSEEALQRAHDTQEQCVRDRTAELARLNAALQAEVAERAHAEDAVRKEKQSLEGMNQLMVDREGRILELKREINALLQELGRPSKYHEPPRA